MKPEIFWIPGLPPGGRLGIMARPRSGEWLRDEVAGWCSVGLSSVVCLLEAAEARELGLEDEAMLCESSRIEFISFPISDRGVPSSVERTTQLVERLLASLRNGSSVAIHCRAGIGRSSLIAGCVLLALGFPEREIFPRLSRARGLQVPDTATQVAWLTRFGQIYSRP